jgi:hypothetical protein
VVVGCLSVAKRHDLYAIGATRRRSVRQEGSNDLRKRPPDRAGVKVDFTACERSAKSGTVSAKQFAAAKHALTDIPVWQHGNDLRGVLEGRVPTTG